MAYNGAGAKIEELSMNDLESASGGFPWVLVALIAAAIIDELADPSDGWVF